MIQIRHFIVILVLVSYAIPTAAQGSDWPYKPVDCNKLTSFHRFANDSIHLISQGNCYVFGLNILDTLTIVDSISLYVVVIHSNTDSNNIIQTFRWINGLKHGPEIVRLSNGYKVIYSYYNNGVLDGPQITILDNRISKYCLYLNGNLVGRRAEFKYRLDDSKPNARELKAVIFYNKKGKIKRIKK
jgi:hypothetical protein